MLDNDIQELEDALKIAARIVSLYGEPYLPVFNRLVAELEAMKKKKNQTELALELARKYSESTL